MVSPGFKMKKKKGGFWEVLPQADEFQSPVFSLFPPSAVHANAVAVQSQHILPPSLN